MKNKKTESPNSYLVSALLFLAAGLVWILKDNLAELGWTNLTVGILFFLCSIGSFYQYNELKKVQP